MTGEAVSAVGAAPEGWMARGARALWSRRLTLATIILILPMAVANRMTHDPAAITSPAHLEAVRAGDRALADDRDLLVWHDQSSYYAMASPDRATSYLAHRPPFAYRVLVPAVARWLSPWLGVLGSFGALGVLGYVAAVLAVHQIFLSM